MSKNIYGECALDYIKAGYSATPAVYESKRPAIKEWTTYCRQLPTEKEYLNWTNTFEATNLDICLGKASGIIALDFDSTAPEIIDLIEHMMPSSPVERIGSKGWVRFFRYNGEASFAQKYNGEVVFEVLSDNKKVTIPPSIHPSGMQYKWRDNSLLDVPRKELPMLPMFLVSSIELKLKTIRPGTTSESPLKLINGRNDALSSECATLISQGVPLDEAIKKLIEFDRGHHDEPLFTDIGEYGHNEPYTNALTFYSNHLRFVNSKRFRDHKNYEIPITASAVNDTYVEEILKKKEQKKEEQKNIKENALEFRPPGALGLIYDHILANSYVPQPAFALSSSLAVMATLIGRKTMFEGVASNLYLLNIAGSGAGKDKPMQIAKRMLTEINAFHLIGAGDYVSDASLMDELSTSPCRLDIIDEASGLLKDITSNTTTYGGKMADILCELYTSSTERFLGRMTADGRKGVCDRPNVSLLCATTPTGFRESVNKKSIEKGLLGRFLIFRGGDKLPARRLEKPVVMSPELKEHLVFWKNWEAAIDDEFTIGDTRQKVYSVQSTPEAKAQLDHYFREMDALRISQPEDSKYLPIISRLYTQALKISLISACSRIKSGEPLVDTVDVNFAFKVIDYYRSIMFEVVENHIFSNETEAKYVKLFNLIKKSTPSIKQHELNDLCRWLTPRERDSILQELLNDRKIIAFNSHDGDNSYIEYTTAE